MAYALRSFKDAQIGIESTPGTAVAAVEVLTGVMSVPYTSDVNHQPEQDRNNLAANVETPFKVSDELEGEYTDDLHDVFAAYLMGNSVRGNITPTQPDNVNEPNHYLWLYEHGITTANTPDITNGIDTYTYEYGDNIQHYEANFVYTVSWTIEFAPGEPVRVTQNWRGKSSTESSKTGSLSAPTTKQYFPSNLTEFYIDSSFANIGNTQKTGMLLSGSINFETMFTPIYAANGDFGYSGLMEGPKKIVADLVYLRDGTNTEAEKDKWEAQSLVYMGVRFKAQNEMDSGQSNPPYLYIDMAGRYTEWGTADDDDDGRRTIPVTLETAYDSTKANQFSISVGTQMSALPS